MKVVNIKAWQLCLLIMSGVLLPNVVLAEETCLNGYELTAIVVLETDIKQSVESYACRMAFPQDTSTYDLYNQLRAKWKRERMKQKQMRDNVYRRIYGDAWQTKVDEWTQTMAVSQGQSFKPTDIACQDLRKEMGAHTHDWPALYRASAREAASAKYDPLRCKAASVITIKQ